MCIWVEFMLFRIAFKPRNDVFVLRSASRPQFSLSQLNLSENALF